MHLAGLAAPPNCEPYWSETGVPWHQSGHTDDAGQPIQSRRLTRKKTKSLQMRMDRP